ncbi:VanZ family protein [Desulforhopalus sp. 52FAK]
MCKSSYSLYRLVPMVVVMGTIFFLSHQRGDEITLPDFSNSDLVAHMLAYGVLAATILYAWEKSYRTLYPVKVILLTVITCLIYGISDEFHQSFIPGRYVSVLDVVADTVGPLLVCSVWWFVSKKLLIYKILPRS